MSVIASVPETISELTALVQAGDIPAARKLGKQLLNVAGTRELWLIARVADVLENRPRTAVDILRNWWASAPSEADRAIIAACAPKNGEQRHRPQAATGRAPRWNGRNNYQAPSTVTTKQRSELRRRRKSRQEQADDAAFRRYQAERAGVAEGAQILDRDDAARAEQVYASGFDYDRAALYGTDVAFRCLSCSISRGRYDLDHDRMQAGHGDDGLCAECRESGRPGIPPLPPGHTLTDAVTARCSYIWEHVGTNVGTAAARVALRTEWKQATAAAVRAAIADYVTAHLPAEEATEAPADLGICASCPDERTIRDLRGVAVDDGLCAECRAADPDQPEPAAA